MGGRRAVTLAALALALAPAPAHGAGFLPREPDERFQGAIAMEPSGRAMLFGLEPNIGSFASELYGVRREASGAYGGRTLIASSGPSGLITGLATAADPLGRVHVAWSDIAPPAPVRIRTVRADGTLTAVQDLGVGVVSDIAVDSTGRTVVVWVDGGGANQVIRARVYSVGAAPGPVLDLSAPGQDASAAQVAVSPSGRAVAVWQRSDGTDEIVQARAIDLSNSALGPVQELSAAGADAELPHVAVDAQGRATFVWQRPVILLGSPTTVIQSRRRAADGTLSVTTDVSANQLNDAANARVAVDGAGRAAIVWEHPLSPGSGFLFGQRRDAGGSLVHAIAPGGDLPDPQFPSVAVDSSGRGFIAWTRSGGPTHARPALVQAQTLAPDGRLGPITTIGPAAFGRPEIEIDASGNALIAPGLGVYDATPPRFTGAAIPARVERAVPTAMSVTVADAFGGATPPQIGWDFGDSTRATGATVRHAYARAGRYSLGVVVRDLGGNAAGGTQSVEVVDTRRPGFADLAMLRDRFRVARGATAISATAAGTRFTYELTELARVRIGIERAVAGRRAGGRCVRVRRGRPRTGRRCTAWARAGALRRGFAEGRRRVGFSGRIGRRALTPGRYRAVLTARDPSGNLSRARRIGFRVVRR
jgi:hypothetical protein